MITQSSRSLLDISSQCKTIPIVENRVHFTQVLDISQIKAILLRHCNLFEFTSLLHNAHRRALSVYVLNNCMWPVSSPIIRVFCL